MDPIMMLRLGQIRQQEILESVQRDQRGVAVAGQQAASLLRRVFARMSARSERTPQQAVCVEYVDYSDKFAPIR